MERVPGDGPMQERPGFGSTGGDVADGPETGTRELPMVDFDTFSPDYAQNWATRLRELRESCPVAYSNAHGGFWVPTRHEDIVRIVKDDATFSSRHDVGEGPGRRLGVGIPENVSHNIPIELDPPELTDYRDIALPHFSPTSAARMRPRMDALADEFIDGFIETGRADLVEDLAAPVPVCLCVVDVRDAREVTYDGGLLDAMVPGSVLVVHSSIAPREVLDLAERARARQVAVVDAPISGGAAAARDGRLTTMVGAEPAVLTRVRPILEAFSGSVHHVGPLGSGLTSKLINNVLCAANLGLAREALRVGAQAGIDPDALRDMLITSSGGSFALTVLSTLVDPDPDPDPDLGAHALALLRKDAALFTEMRAGQPDPPSLLIGAARTALEDLRTP